MSDRDRQNPYDRNQQYGGNRANAGPGSSNQASQWQSDGDRQHGGDWQQDGQRGEDADASSAYRFSGQGNASDAQGYGRGDAQSYGLGQSGAGGGYRSSSSDNDPRNFDRGRGGYGQHNDRNQSYGQNGDHDRGGFQDNHASAGRWSTQGDYRSRQYDPRSQSGPTNTTGSYAGRDYDASGGNDFGNFTSEDYGGRDFSNRGGSGGGAGGMHPSDTYRPSYGPSTWFNSDNDDHRRNRGSGREEYGDWRKYGESRGFLERAGDEVASWFGDEDASRRREQDHRQGSGQARDGRGPQGQSHRGRGPSNYTRSDERIRDDANDHLTHDHHVDASHITVSVKDGELTLDGTVDSREAKRRAEDCVDHISGVKHVQNNLRVQDRSSTSGGAGVTGGAYGQSSANSGSTYGQSSGLSSGSSTTSSAGHSSSTGANEQSGSASSGTAGSNAPGSSSTTPGQTGASTTGGIGSTATAGVGSASSTRSSDKPS